VFADGLSEEGCFESLYHDLAAWLSSRPEADTDHTFVDRIATQDGQQPRGEALADTAAASMAMS